MEHFPVILADINWIQIVIILIFVLGPLISRFGKPALEQVLPKPDQRPPLPPVGNRPVQPPAAGGRDAMEAEIEEFLRKAGGKAEPRPPRPAQPPVRTLAPPPRQHPLEAEPVVMAEVVDATLVSREKELRPRHAVSDHVRDHIEAQPVSDHGKTLGRGLGQADEHLESRLHEVFDHKLGRLAKDPLTDSDSKSDDRLEGTDSMVWEGAVAQRKKRMTGLHHRSQEIFAMLRSPAGMQQAVILNEILKRPEI